MAKITEIELGPDDPIFSEGLSVFVPISKPSTETSPCATAGTKPASSKASRSDAKSARVPQAILDELEEEMKESVPRQFGKTDESNSPTADESEA